MKKEYDFSKGERGKFYNKDAQFNIPIYLEPETWSFVQAIALKKKIDVSAVVNDLLNSGIKIMEYIKQ